MWVFVWEGFVCSDCLWVCRVLVAVCVVTRGGCRRVMVVLRGYCLCSFWFVMRARWMSLGGPGGVNVAGWGKYLVFVCVWCVSLVWWGI